MNPEITTDHLFGILNLSHWDLFEIWFLVLGISMTFIIQKTFAISFDFLLNRQSPGINQYTLLSGHRHQSGEHRYCLQRCFGSSTPAPGRCRWGHAIIAAQNFRRVKKKTLSTMPARNAEFSTRLPPSIKRLVSPRLPS